jgi:hypothetical protein
VIQKNRRQAKARLSKQRKSTRLAKSKYYAAKGRAVALRRKEKHALKQAQYQAKDARAAAKIAQTQSRRALIKQKLALKTEHDLKKDIKRQIALERIRRQRRLARIQKADLRAHYAAEKLAKRREQKLLAVSKIKASVRSVTKAARKTLWNSKEQARKAVMEARHI